MYNMLYACGLNYVMKDGSMIDKDKVHNLFYSGLLDDPHCIGPRGIRMGGRSRPGVRPNLPFNATDHGTKIWLILCQDECCVHTLKEEQFAWIVPSLAIDLEMGDMPTKLKAMGISATCLRLMLSLDVAVSAWWGRLGGYHGRSLLSIFVQSELARIL